MRVAFLLLFSACDLAAAPRIAIGGIIHETNTFNPRKTEVADFAAGIGGAAGLLRGDEIIRDAEKANSTTCAITRSSARLQSH